MTEQEIENTKNYLNANVGAFLQEDRETQRGRLTGGFPSYVCPVCGSGSGKNGSGIRTKDGIHYTCFSGNCSGEVRNVDGVDLYGLSRGISGFIQTIKAAKEEFDIGDGTLEKITKKKAEKAEEKPVRNFIDYYKKCAADIGKCNYMQRRGISKETSRRKSTSADRQSSLSRTSSLLRMSKQRQELAFIRRKTSSRALQRLEKARQSPRERSRSSSVSITRSRSTPGILQSQTSFLRTAMQTLRLQSLIGLETRAGLQETV